MPPRKKAPPKKPQEPEAITPAAPVDVPAAKKPRRRRGSPKGHLNIWERLYAIGKAVGGVIAALMVAFAEQVKASLPMIQQTAPIWIGIIVGGIAGTVIYYHEASSLKNSDNSDGESPDAANETSTGTGES